MTGTDKPHIPLLSHESLILVSCGANVINGTTAGNHVPDPMDLCSHSLDPMPTQYCGQTSKVWAEMIFF
jgi:hypothetical protein